MCSLPGLIQAQETSCIPGDTLPRSGLEHAPMHTGIGGTGTGGITCNVYIHQPRQPHRPNQSRQLQHPRQPRMQQPPPPPQTDLASAAVSPLPVAHATGLTNMLDEVTAVTRDALCTGIVPPAHQAHPARRADRRNAGVNDSTIPAPAAIHPSDDWDDTKWSSGISISPEQHRQQQRANNTSLSRGNERMQPHGSHYPHSLPRHTAHGLRIGRSKS